MHEFRRGDEGEVRSSTRGGRVVSRDDTGVIAAARAALTSRAASAISRDDRARGRTVERNSKVAGESARVRARARGLQRQRAWRSSHERTSFTSTSSFFIHLHLSPLPTRIVPDQSTAGRPLYFPSVP